MKMKKSGKKVVKVVVNNEKSGIKELREEKREENINQVNNLGYLKLIVLPEDIVLKLDKLITLVDVIILKNKLIKAIENEDIFKEIMDRDFNFLENIFKNNAEKRLFDIIKQLDSTVFIEDYLEFLDLGKNELKQCLKKIDNIVEECRNYILDFVKYNKDAYMSEKTLLYALAVNKYFWKDNYPVNLYYRLNKIYTYKDKNNNKFFENRLTILFPKKLKDILNEHKK